MRERLGDLIGALSRLSPRPVRGRLSVAHWWTLPTLVLLLLVAIVVPYELLYYLAYLWGWLLLGSWLWVRYQCSRIELSRLLHSGWAQVGDELEEHWELQNNSWLPLLWLEVSDGSTVPGYNARRVGAAPALSVAAWTTSSICRRRGRYRLGPLAIELADPFGLFRYRRVEAETREMLIYPPLVRLPPLARPRGQRGGVATAALLNVLPTPSAGGIRDYRPGDPLSFVHWRAVAHTGRLMVKEFDQEIAGAVWIVLDLARAAQSGDGEDSTEELGVVLACSLANVMLDEGRMVGFFAHGAGRYLVQPGRGRHYLWEFMGALVDVEAAGERPLHEVLAELGAVARGHAAVVVITPDTGGDWISALASLTGGGAATLALLIESPGRDASAAARLERAGIRHHAFRTGERLPLLAPARGNRPGYRISPLGRAIKIET